MKLYHFTDPNRLPSIQEYGIAKGDVPITITGGYNAPWFTTDPSPDTQGWAGGGYKTGLRLTVNIPEGDSKLKKWTDITQEELDAQPNDESRDFLKNWYDALNRAGGNGEDNWYVYHGVVPFSWVEEIEES